MNQPRRSIKYWPVLAAAGASISYWIAFSHPLSGGWILFALPCLFFLGRLQTPRQAFYGGLLTGIAMYAPPLLFFFRVFGPAGCALYLIAGLPIAFFVLLLHFAYRRVPPNYLIVLTPMLWTGIEFFRSELYKLRFAWLLPGQAIAFLPGARWLTIGVYGVGFVFSLVAALLLDRRRWVQLIGNAATMGLAVLIYWPASPPARGDANLNVAGIQYEFPSVGTAAIALDRLAVAHPEAALLVMSEYTFDGPVPELVRAVCRKHHRYLVVGGSRPLTNGRFYDMAFVIGPDGNDVFEQAKSVPVQFMADGLPAEHRRVWNSPWGKIGIAICYDLSYGRVIDDFVRQGAAGLIIPTEDAQNWGEYERRMLHGRMAPIRSAEYGIPTFGVWSSGVSQLTDRTGRVIATAGYPGQGDMIAGPFDLQQAGHVPWDRMFAMVAVVGTGLFIMFLLVPRITKRH